MITLSFNVTKHDIVRTDSCGALSAGNVEYVECAFTFDADWTSAAKMATFSYAAEEPMRIALTSDRCIVPYQVLRQAGDVLIGVTGAIGSRVMASKVCRIKVEPGAPISGSDPIPYTPTVLEQVLSAFAATSTRWHILHVPIGASGGTTLANQENDLDPSEMLPADILVGSDGYLALVVSATASETSIARQGVTLRGLQGIQGQQGVKGDKGDTGSTGPAGRGANIWFAEESPEAYDGQISATAECVIAYQHLKGNTVPSKLSVATDDYIIDQTTGKMWVVGTPLDDADYCPVVSTTAQLQLGEKNIITKIIVNGDDAGLLEDSSNGDELTAAVVNCPRLFYAARDYSADQNISIYGNIPRSSIAGATGITFQDGDKILSCSGTIYEVNNEFIPSDDIISVTKLGSTAACSVSLEKIKHPKGSPTAIIRVHLQGISAYTEGDDLKLKLYRKASARGKGGRWGYADRWGYGQIAGTTQTWSSETITHPAVPVWMPNDGYIQEEIPITASDISAGYKDIDLCTYLLPLVKLRYNASTLRLFGCAREKRSHEISWHLFNGNSLIGLPKNTVEVGIAQYQSARYFTVVYDSANPIGTSRISRERLWVRLK
ncbi:MAG: hypothetical protein PHT58_07180 [Eubacteriales bacterium]|nr:hypothetical protein [Eubacteriales bacterium]